MHKFIHIVPYDGIGGVESAARSMGVVNFNDINFSIDFIFKNVTGRKQRFATFNPLPIFSAAWRASRGDVDFVITSLWRSAIVGLLAKLLRPKLKLIAFLHCSGNASNWLDFIFTHLAILLATEVWGDSQATLTHRVPQFYRKKCRVISFVIRHFEVLPVKKVEPTFIFWGRICPQKGLERAIRLFAEIKKTNEKARFWIVGPDGGLLAALQELCDTLGLSISVEFPGPMTHDDIIRFASQASFYLQTSRYEGMAMSVVESMQLGLVPIVTPVGEIGSYCKHCDNSVVVESDQKAIEDILKLLDSDDSYQKLRSNAIETWKDHLLYRESVLKACDALIDASASYADKETE